MRRIRSFLVLVKNRFVKDNVTYIVFASYVWFVASILLVGAHLFDEHYSNSMIIEHLHLSFETIMIDVLP